jgi:FdhD protein
LKELSEPRCADGEKRGNTTDAGFADPHVDPVQRFSKGVLTAIEHTPVKEFPIKLIVNGRELTTLIASPHNLRFLVAGFLRLQGFVKSVEDFQMLAVCEDMRVANVQIAHELPERLTPILTSGCGTGITFTLPGTPKRRDKAAVDRATLPPSDVFALLEELAGRTEQYKTHGGIHSAAVGTGGSLLLFAEDIGRHNTLDRIAGEALFKEMDLYGTMLAVSGRVSSEMASKATVLGIALIASRTSPTDMAVRICAAAGITLIGYVRRDAFNVYCHPARLALH